MIKLRKIIQTNRNREWNECLINSILFFMAGDYMHRNG